MYNGRSGCHVPALRIDLLDQKVKEVAHPTVAIAEEARVVFPGLDVVLRYLPCLVPVFGVLEFKRTNLERLLVGDSIPEPCRFTRFRRRRFIAQALLNVVDDHLERVFVYACNKDLTIVTQDEDFRLVNTIGPVLRTFNLPLFNALGEIEDPSGFCLPYLWQVCICRIAKK